MEDQVYRVHQELRASRDNQGHPDQAHNAENKAFRGHQVQTASPDPADPQERLDVMGNLERTGKQDHPVHLENGDPEDPAVRNFYFPNKNASCKTRCLSSTLLREVFARF